MALGKKTLEVNVWIISMLWIIHLVTDVDGQTVTTTQHGYLEIGCFADDPYERDLDGAGYAYHNLQLDVCAEKCRLDGAPYLGLQKGAICFCGSSFGRYGPANEAKCNYTCGGNHCGGYHLNSVYTTMKTNTSKSTDMELVVYTERKTFSEARKQCILKNGDLATMKDMETFTNVRNKLNEVNSTSPEWFWFNLKNVSMYDGTNTPSNNMYWLGDLEHPVAVSNYSTYWDDGETFNFSCGTMSRDTKKWTMKNCVHYWPYICLQDSTPSSTPTPAGSGNEEDTGSGISNKVTLYVVIPLFLFCYGGSFVFYAVYKCCRKHRRKKLYRERFQNEVSSDPGTPPPKRSNLLTPMPDNLRSEPEKPPPPYRNRDGSVHMSYIEPFHESDDEPAQKSEPYRETKPTPVQRIELLGPPPNMRNSRADGHPPYRKIKGENNKDNINTEDDVGNTKQDKEEARRATLLRKALNEARERRRTNTPAPSLHSRRNSSRDQPAQAATPGGQSRNSVQHGDSRKASVASNKGNSQNADLSSMSVAEIMRMKQIVNDSQTHRVFCSEV